ncbi:MAG TPA: YfcC family protein [Lutibacter sp.]
MKKLKFPSAQTILLVIAALVALLTWVVPSGKYDNLSYNAADNTFIRKSLGIAAVIPAEQASLDALNIKIPLKKFTDGAITKPISIPNTYKKTAANSQGFFEFVQSPIKGIIAASDIIFLVLIIGGLIGIMNMTGAFDAGIFWLVTKLKGREYILIILTTTLVALGGTTFGFAEETLAFFPILIPVFIAAKYDAMVGLACIFLGSSVGSMCSTTNPFSTIIASDAAGINWTTGLEGRILMFIISVTISILYILRYAKKIKKNPTKSLIYDQKETMESHFGQLSKGKIVPLNNKLKLILLVFSACFIIMIIGVAMLDWWFIEMTSVFLVGAIAIGFIAKINESDFVNAFSKGAGELLGVAFIIGIARGVSILMDDGLISDTVLYNASALTEGMNKGVFVNSLFFIYNGLSFFIPSSSGMAVLTMPIISPLADTVGIGREIIVNTYQYGQGLFAIINPTGLILASLAIVKIGFDKWLKFVMPLVIVLILVSMIMLTISVY